MIPIVLITPKALDDSDCSEYSDSSDYSDYLLLIAEHDVDDACDVGDVHFAVAIDIGILHDD